MRRDLTLRLDCCGAEARVKISETGIRGGELNELRRNVICAACGEIVILSFSPSDPGRVVEQEIVGTPSS